MKCWFIMKCEKGREVEAIQSVISLKKKSMQKKIKSLEDSRRKYRGSDARVTIGMQKKISSCYRNLTLLKENEIKFNALQRSNRKIVDDFYDTIR